MRGNIGYSLLVVKVIEFHGSPLLFEFLLWLSEVAAFTFQLNILLEESTRGYGSLV
jgi:hypothetical protein